MPCHKVALCSMCAYIYVVAEGVLCKLCIHLVVCVYYSHGQPNE